MDGGPHGRDRAQRPADRRARDRVGGRPGRGRDRRGGYACEAICDGGGRQARERDTGADRAGARGMSGVDETLANVETLFARTEELRAKLEQTEDPDAANDILEQLTELLKQRSEEHTSELQSP